MKSLWTYSVLTCSLLLFSLALEAHEAPAKVYIISPVNGETVESPVLVRFGLQGIGVAPAGVERQGTGHHHLLVNFKTLPEAGQPLGKDVKHFGGGQTEVLLELPPGKHSLQLIMGDHLHVPLEPSLVSEKIIIEVKDGSNAVPAP